MTNKKSEAKRLVIFLLLAFGITWIPAIILNKTIGYHGWFETYKVPVFSWIIGFGPALANIITRKITGEGWRGSLLHLNLKGNLKYYIFALAGMSVIGIFQGILATLTIGGGDWSDWGKDLEPAKIFSTLLTVFSTAPLMAFNTFGEEFGWRGYMNQKMKPLFGTVGTVLIGGVIWGMWHAELTVEGHNFGTDYPGYPYMGFLCMCVSCTSLGIILMWLTEKTGSIYPAAIMHAMNNLGGTFTSRIFMSGIPGDFTPTPAEQMLFDVPLDIAAAVILVLMLREERKSRKKLPVKC